MPDQANDKRRHLVLTNAFEAQADAAQTEQGLQICLGLKIQFVGAPNSTFGGDKADARPIKRISS